MAVREFFMLSLVALILPYTHGTDYCNQSETLCSANGTHVDCLPRNFGDQCFDNVPLGAPSLYIFSSSFLIRLLYLVNSIRNEVAGGLYPGADGDNLPKASRMVYMEWDDELASMAEKITLTCSNASESMCYNTPIYLNAGLLSYSLPVSNGTVDPIDIINKTISKWEEGSSVISSSDVASYTENSGNSDFATLITDRNSRIGCSMAELPVDESYSTFYMVCILSTQTIEGCPIYTQAKESRCGCTLYSRSHPYLCAGGEDYDPSACPDAQFCTNQAATLCPTDTTHVACVNSAENCETISLGSQEIETILEIINSYRNQTVSGSVIDASNENFPPASRTAATTWDIDLSNHAVLHAATCPTSKDECHNSRTFSNSGQSIYYAASTDPSDVTQILGLAVDSWFDQHSSMEQSVVFSYESNSIFEDFAQLVNERNVKVGCSVSYDSPNSVIYVVCNFAVTNTEGCQVYSDGTSASACNTTSPMYSSLCESTEYDYYVKQVVQYNTDQCV